MAAASPCARTPGMAARAQRGRRAAPSAARAAPGPELSAAAWYSGEDLYAVLGLPPTADTREIKQAYFQLMRQHHPDQAVASGTFDEANSFAALLNQVYATLSDPDSRGLYDAIMGYGADAVNPFEDDSLPATEVFVDEVSCIGCGKCVRAAPDAFFIEASKYGRARVVPGADVAALEFDITVAIETCPVDCIHWVTAPQLALLEATLSRMARVDAFLMMRQHRAPGNVFAEAHRAWHKRQAALAALREQQAFAAASDAASSTTGWVSWWSAYVDVRGGGGSGSGSSASRRGAGGDEPCARDPAARRVMELASAASRALRRWQMFQRLCMRPKALTE